MARIEEQASGIDIDALPVSTRMRNLIRGIQDPEHCYASRSERVMAVLVAMVGAGCSEAQVEGVVLDPDFPISAHVLEQKIPQKYLTKQIAHARKSQSISTWPNSTKICVCHRWR